MSTIALPWPHSNLSPNARKHWRPVAKAKKAYREAAVWACAAAKLRPMTCARLAVSITFHAPDKRHRDIDNMLASIKAGLDGIADVCGVDDSKWSITIAKGEPRKGGAVVVVLSAPADSYADLHRQILPGASECLGADTALPGHGEGEE
jgi:crossover junction endodeoxyribonuclease RusA